jgi:hypothetical protein
MAEGKKGKKEIAVRRRSTPVKIRGGKAYQAKVRTVTKWHKRVEKIREKPAEVNPNTKVQAKRKDLQPLNYYVDKIKKPSK